MNQEDVDFRETHWGQEPYCKVCGSGVFWQECEHCDEYGFTHHDCGEDTCCCRTPENNVVCDVCDGKHGWYVCPDCDRKEVKP